MTLTKNAFLLLTPLLLLIVAAPSRAASNGIHDDAHFFSDDAISQAQRVIDQIERRHGKDVLVETLPTVPDDQKTRLEEAGQDQQKREAVFAEWAESRFRTQGVNGIYILITKNPAHLEVSLGNNTRQDRLLSRVDRDAVRTQLLTAFRQKNYDQGLTSAVQTISQRMDANAPAGSARQSSVPPPTYNPSSFPRQQPRSWGLGGLACILIAVVAFIILIRGIFGRSGGTYYGGGYPQGGYPQGGYQQGGYYPPPGGGYGYGGGGGGGGFGRGFLGGLLGGALGGYAADRWMNSGQQSGGGYVPPATGGDFGGGGGQADTSSDSSGGDFGDSGGGGGGGGDWGGGGGGGGGDFGGGGGGDSGGSGGSGGDF